MYYSSLTSVVALLIINALTNAVPLSRRNLESDEESTRAAFRRELGDDLTTSTVIRNLGVSIPRKNCKEIYDEMTQAGTQPMSGLYMINPDPMRGDFVVYCDMKLAGGGWTVISRRIDGSLDFKVGKDVYQAGFGRYNHNFWLGLERIRSLTARTTMELWVGMESYEVPNSSTDWEPRHTWAHARYKYFVIGDRASHYTLTVGNFDQTNSTVYNDTFATEHNGKAFRSDCASRGGWWYKTCSDSSLTGTYYQTKTVTGDPGMSWEGYQGKDVSLKTVIMAVRPISYGLH